MYIRVLKTWCGIEGMFVGGGICEIDEAVLEKIGNKRLGKKRLRYEQVPAPWDAQKDETAVRVAELQGQIGKAAVELERLEDELLNMQANAGPREGSTSAAVEQAEDDHVKAEQCLRELSAPAATAAAKEGHKPTEGNKEKASDLAAKEADARRVEQEKSCLVVKAQGQLLVLNGDIGLTELEVAAASTELAAMRAELYELRPDLKPKDDENGRTEKTDAPDGPGSVDEKDAADAEGQTGAAGQIDGVQE